MSRTWLMIRVWFLAAALVVSLAGSPTLAQGATVVRVDPSTLSVQVNDTINIFIKVDNVANLAAFEIHLAFNPATLEVISMTNGGFVGADITVQNIFDNVSGTIDYAVAQMNRPPVQGSGALLNITFRAKANGNSTITTHATPTTSDGLLLVDPDGLVISVSWASGNIDVGGSQSITATSTFTPTSTNTPTLTLTPTSTTSVNLTTVTPTFTSSPTRTPTLTLTPTKTPTVTPTPGGPLGTHIVRWGEWLYCIGRAYKVSPWAIAEENGIWWPYMIFPNQKLTIPTVPWTNMTSGPVCKAQFIPTAPTPIPPTPNPATPVTVIPPDTTPIPATTAPPSTCRATYVVQAGDTLYRIAVRYGTTYMEIARVNGISDPRVIYPGQQLCIP